MDRAFDAMKQFVVGNEAPVYDLARNDSEALAFIQRLHPDYPMGWVRDPWPNEVVDPMRQSPDGKAYFSCTIEEILTSIRAILARDAARVAVVEALLPEVESCVVPNAAAVLAAQLEEERCSMRDAPEVDALPLEEEPYFITDMEGEVQLPTHISLRRSIFDRSLRRELEPSPG